MKMDASFSPESFVKLWFFSRLLRLIRASSSSSSRSRRNQQQQKIPAAALLRRRNLEKLDSCENENELSAISAGSGPPQQEDEEEEDVETEFKMDLSLDPNNLINQPFVEIDRRGERGGSLLSSLLRQAVKQVHFGCPEEKRRAAEQIQRLARKSVPIRKFLAALGVIPSLVSMLDFSDSCHRLSALKALIQLAAGNHTNKNLIVEAGAVAKLSRLMDIPDLETQEAMSILVLAISAVDRNKPIIGSLDILSALVHTLDSGTQQGRMASLAALYNLSSCLDVVDNMVKKGSVQALMKIIQSQECRERALSVLGNLVLTRSAREALESCQTFPGSLIHILGSQTSPKSQELALYVLMILAHHSSNQRKALRQEQITALLVELALLGSPLARKRAMRILTCLRDDYKENTFSGTVIATNKTWYQQRRPATGSPDNLTEMADNKKAIKDIVRQSLQRNMDHIVKRADSVDPCRKRRSATSSSSSESLPC